MEVRLLMQVHIVILQLVEEGYMLRMVGSLVLHFSYEQRVLVNLYIYVEVRRERYFISIDVADLVNVEPGATSGDLPLEGEVVSLKGSYDREPVKRLKVRGRDVIKGMEVVKEDRYRALEIERC